jgi:hypothetical protein
MTGKTVSVDGDYGTLSVAALKGRMQQLDGTPVQLQQFTEDGVIIADYDSLCFGTTIRLRWKSTKTG